MAQGHLGAGLHFKDARMGAQQHVVVHQVAEALLFAEHAQQHHFDLAYALFESTVGVDQLDHGFDVFVPRCQYLGVPLAQRNLPVAGLGPLGHGHQRLDLVTDNSARTLNLGEGYGIAVGRPANLVVLDAESDYEAVRRQAKARVSIRAGNVLMTRVPERVEFSAL